MIIDVKKYLFIGAKEDLDDFFERAQKKGMIEFIPTSSKKPLEMPSQLQHVAQALKILRKQPVKNQLEIAKDVDYAYEIAEKVLALKHDIEKYREEKRLLEGEIVRVGPFGDFSMEDIDYIEREAHRKIQFFCMKTEKSHKTNISDEVIYVNTEYDLDYFIAINKEPTQYPEMIEMRIDRPLGELKTQLASVQEVLHDREVELKDLADNIDFLHDAFIEELSNYHLLCAKKEVSYPLGVSLFSIEAWVPQNKIPSLFALLDGMAVHGEQIGIEKNDRVPTYMENKGVPRLGEDLVKIYDIPATTDRDPSGWVIWAFGLFFAMIIADAGYGLLYLGLALFLKYKFPQLKGQARRFLKLLTFLAISCVIWGILTCSYFGANIAPSNPLGKISLTQYLAEKKASYHMEIKDDVYDYWIKQYPQLATAQTSKQFLEIAAKKKGIKTSYEALAEFSDNILLEFSLMIGVIHLTLSFFRYLLRHWAGLGWVAFLVGSYLYFPSVLHATSLIHFLGWVDKETAFQVGLQLIYGGMGGAVLLALLQKRLKGIGEIANVLTVFADALSYLRLYALALAGATMASTFNEIGEIVGLVVGVVVILLGHSVNILLGVVSGVIHGLRLNFLEWYHYSFEGGGKLFNPLKRLKRLSLN